MIRCERIPELERLSQLIGLAIGLIPTLSPSTLALVANRTMRIIRKVGKWVMLAIRVCMTALPVRDATFSSCLPQDPPRRSQQVLLYLRESPVSCFSSS